MPAAVLLLAELFFLLSSLRVASVSCALELDLSKGHAPSSRSGVCVVSFAKLLRLRLDLLHNLSSYLDLETAVALEKRCSLGGRCSEMARVYALSPWRSPVNERPLSPSPYSLRVKMRMRVRGVRCGTQKRGNPRKSLT